MKKLFILSAFALFAVACGDSNSSETTTTPNDSTSAGLRPVTESTSDSGTGTNAGLDTTGGNVEVRSGIGSGDPVINTGTKTDTTKN